MFNKNGSATRDKTGINNMSKSSKAVAEVVESNTVNPSAVMQVVKESQEQPGALKPANIHDVLNKLKEQWHLSQQHTSLNYQLDKLRQFKSGIGEETSLTLRNANSSQFQSSDPQAVEALIDICINNISRKIEKIEVELLSL